MPGRLCKFGLQSTCHPAHPAVPESPEDTMTLTNRLLLCAGVVLVDTVLFLVPLTALFLAYIILRNPAWFREFLSSLDPPADTP